MYLHCKLVLVLKLLHELARTLALAVAFFLQVDLPVVQVGLPTRHSHRQPLLLIASARIHSKFPFITSINNLSG